AWDRSAPAERLSVEICHGDKMLVRVVADQPRPDLAANGIGDGKYAFVAEIDPAIASNGDARLRVLAGIAGQDCSVVLRRQGAPEEPQLANVVLGEIRARDQRLQGQLKQLVTVANDRRSVDQGLVERLGDSLGKLDGAIGNIDQRMEVIEVFQVRFETLLKDYEDRVKTAEMRSGGKIPLWLLTWAGFATLAAVGLAIKWAL
ncbi:MAG TPA: hypothetical protein VF920_06555, partial [Dongiaceae bacterium]